MSAESSSLAFSSLYVHIPFCQQRCPYCDFAIHVGGEQLYQPYLTALITELGQLGRSRAVRSSLDTVYLGGGTPGLLPVEMLGQLLQAVSDGLGIAAGAELTLEANPADVTPDSVGRWLGLGINRVSLGVQSLDDPTLRWLGRNHDAAGAERAMMTLREAGPVNFSCDLIYAIPGQPEAVFAQGLERALQYSPDHLSCYELTVEPGTALARRVAQGRERRASEDEFVQQYRLARDLLVGGGMAHYEVSNYARPGFESRHNLGYWRGRPYLAAGCGAHGFLGPDEALRLGFKGDPSQAVGLRYWNRRNASSYTREVLAGGSAVQGSEWISQEQHHLEMLACGLRLNEGVLLQGNQLEEAERLARMGLIELRGLRAVATSRGLEVVDRLTLELCAA